MGKGAIASYWERTFRRWSVFHPAPFRLAAIPILALFSLRKRLRARRRMMARYSNLIFSSGIL